MLIDISPKFGKGHNTMATEHTEVTAEMIRKLVTDSIEPNKPLEVLDWLKGYVGKPITTRIEKAINEAFPGEDFKLIRAYGMTQLENGVYRNLRYSPSKQKDRNNWKGSMTILLAHSESAVPLQEVYLTEHNRQYTHGTPERNAERTACLEDTQRAKRLAKAINAYHAAAVELKEAMKPFSADRYHIEEEFVKNGKG